MDSEQEQVEGQAITRAILAGDENAWNDFQAVYGEKLLRSAGKRALAANLRTEFSAEDIVNDFICNQILPCPGKMFGPVARGERPLTPRLLLSLRYYCNTLQRRAKATIHCDTAISVHSSESGYQTDSINAGEAIDLIKRQISEQQRVIREAFFKPSRIKTPQREILLLSERVFFANHYVLSYCSEDQPEVVDSRANQMVENFYPWNEEESVMLIPNVNKPLAVVWRGIGKSLFSRPFGVDGNAIANQIQVRRNTWDIWVKRGRQRVISSTGVERAKELFKNWPKKLFETHPESGTNGNELR